jgi:hypothetical protein
MGHIDPTWTGNAWYQSGRDLPVIAAVKTMGAEPVPPPPLPLDETLRHEAWNRRGIAYNPEAAFARHARLNHLGSPLTQEFDVTWKGKNLRVQGFTGAILYCEVGNWGNIKNMDW